MDSARLIVELEWEDREGAIGEVKIEFAIQQCGLGISPTVRRTPRRAVNDNVTVSDELKFVPFQDGKSNKVTHVTVKEHIVNCAQKNHRHGNDIAMHSESGDDTHMKAEPAMGTLLG